MSGLGALAKAAKAAEAAQQASKMADAAIVAKSIEAPSIVIPSKISRVKEAVRQSKGDFGAKRVERAADEIPNLEKLYKEETLRQAFSGDNAKAMLSMRPEDFERFAHPLTPLEKPWPGSGPKKETLSTDEYIKYLSSLNEFHDVPFLEINKQEQGLPILPFISGHEGRHRNRAMAQRGEKAGLVQLLPRAELREPFPRRSQEEYIEALKKELEMTGNKVLPEKYTVPGEYSFGAFKEVQRPEIILPDVYAKGGAVHMSDGGDPERAAFGVYPSSGKRREELNVSRNVNAPLQLARGWLAGTAGLPGDIETLGRLLANFSFGPGGVKVSTESVLPTSEYFQEVIPGRDTSPAGELFSGAGQLTGGLGAVKGAKAAGRAAKAAGEALAPKAGQMAEGYLQKAGLMPGVIKPKGGNWLEGQVENATQSLRSPADAGLQRKWYLEQIDRLKARGIPPNQEILQEVENLRGLESVNDWIDKKLNKYIKNEMGTPEDPVRKLAEQNILHFEPQQVFGDAPSTLMRKRAGAGMPTPLFGQSEMARRWESLADRAIDPFPAGSYKYGALDESLLASNPWLEKVPDEAMVYKAKGLRRDMGFDHLIDELRNATRADSDLPARLRWKPEDLSKVTMEQAVKRVHDINEWRAAQKAEANAAKAQNPATFLHKEYETVPGTAEPNQKGLKWVELKAPSNETMPLEERKALIQKLRAEGGNPETWPREQLEAALKYEGETMGHCVGGYCPDVESGRSRIFSLRDKKGEPHVTVEVEPKTRNLKDRTDWFTSQPEDVQNKITTEALELERTFGTGLEFGSRENWQKAFASVIDKNMGEEIPNITQIKGKGNKAPKNEYLPFVQDFVKSGQWARVGDYRNTGLRERAEMFDALDLNKLKAAGHDVPEHLTPDESKKYSDLLYTIDTGKNPETGLPIKNYAEGGAVGIETTPDMSDGGKIIPTKEVNAKKGGAVEKMTDTLTRGGMDKDKATLHAIKLAQAREQEPIKVKKKAIPEGAEEFRRAVEQKFQAGGLAKFLTGGAKAAQAAKEAHPLVMPPAKALTKEEIRPIAQRIAEQMTGEFVRPDPTKSVNPAGKSRKVFEREKDLPVEVISKIPQKPAPVVDYEQHLGSVLVGVPGDPTIGGLAREGALSKVHEGAAELRRLGDVEFEHPVQLFGGPRYGAYDPENKFWASNLGAARAIQNRVSAFDAPVLGQYIKMSPESTNFALHNLDALLSYMQPEKLSKSKLELLNKEIRKGSPKYGQFPGFSGFEDPVDVLLQSQMNSDLRKHVAETLMKPTITEKLGLRPGSDVLFGITKPELRNIETGVSGYSIGQMKPGAELTPSAHPTYDYDIPGLFLGQSKYPVPHEIAFPASTAYTRSQLKPGVQEFNMLKMIGPREKIDPQYIDQIKMYEDLMKEYTGKKAGGAVKPKAQMTLPSKSRKKWPNNQK